MKTAFTVATLALVASACSRGYKRLEGAYAYDAEATAWRLVSDGLRTPAEVEQIKFPNMWLVIAKGTVVVKVNGQGPFASEARLKKVAANRFVLLYEGGTPSETHLEVVADGFWGQVPPAPERVKYRRLAHAPEIMAEAEAALDSPSAAERLVDDVELTLGITSYHVPKRSPDAVVGEGAEGNTERPTAPAAN